MQCQSATRRRDRTGVGEPPIPLATSIRRTALALAAGAIFVSSIAFAQAPRPAAGPERSVKAPLASKSLLLDVARADGVLVAVGERGHILISEDGGASWRQTDVPTRATLTGVHFHDRRLGWAVGHDSVILRTVDGGSSWELVNYAPEENNPFLDVWFADARKGFAIGAYGRFQVTDDGGTTWQDQPISDEDFHLNQIARSSNGKLYVAAESGSAFRSDDGGTTWLSLEVPYEGSFFGVFPLDGDSVLLFGLRGHLLRSDDAGATWTPIETGTTSMLNGAVRLADGRIVIGGLGGSILVSADGGRSFVLRQQSSRAGIQSVVDAGNGNLVLTGEFGVRQMPVAELSK